jgi:hypothetical protein
LPREETLKNETLTPSANAMQSLCQALFSDIQRLRPSDFLKVDLQYLLRRFSAEGPKFGLITLPLLGKAIELALIREEPLQVPQGWRLTKDSRLPQFLNHLFKRVFEENGLPRSIETIDVKACLLLRQLTLLFSKIEGGLEESEVIHSVEEFRLRTLKRKNILSSPELILAREILRRFFEVDHPCIRELHEFKLNPWGRHGPGAVSDKSSPSKKWDFSLWPGLPLNLFRFNKDLCVEIKNLYTQQPYARVTCVPKDFRGPRVICIEPKENQFAQQGLMDILYRLLPSHPLTRNSICFESTSINEKFCFNSDIGTIDLKDASDNLSLELSRLLLPKWFFSLVTRYRTRTVRGNGQMWVPHCLATMGNACCFPLETLIFWAIAQSTIVLFREKDKSIPFNSLRVYGDDIILPKKVGPRLIEVLEGCGLIVNLNKTCLKTLVKESCGEWVVAGESQRLIKIKSADVRSIRSWIQFRQYSLAALKLGLFNLAYSMRHQVLNFIKPSFIKERWNKYLQKTEWRQPVFARTGRREKLSGPESLYATQVRNDTAPFLNGTFEKVKLRWLDTNPYEDYHYEILREKYLMERNGTS